MANELYARLGVEPGASAEQLKKAYFRSLRAHTAEEDPVGHQAVREAWEILGDEERRRRYDAGQRGGGEAEQLLIQGRTALADEELERAVDLLRRAIAIAPTLEDAWQLLVRALGVSKRHDEAIETASKAHRRFGTHSSMLVLAEAHFLKVRALTNGLWANVTSAHHADLEAATRAYLEAAAAVPSDSSGFVGAAQVAQYRKNHAEARRLAERAIAADGKVDFDDVAALQIIAYSHLAEKNIEASAATLDRICSIAPESDEVREAVARDLVEYAVMMFKNAAFRESQMMLGPCLRLAPTLGVVLELQRLLERPLRCLDALDRLKGDKLVPRAVIALGIWGYFVFFEEPEASESRRALEGVFEQLDALSARQLADALYRLRDHYGVLWELQDKVFNGLLSAACKDARIPLRPSAEQGVMGSRPPASTTATKPAASARPARDSSAPKPAASKRPAPPPSPVKPPASKPAPPNPAASNSTAAGAPSSVNSAQPTGWKTATSSSRVAAATAKAGPTSPAEGGESNEGIAKVTRWMAVLVVLLVAGLFFRDGCPSAPAPAPTEGSAASPAAAASATCGNGVVEADETCDDGNTVVEQCAYGLPACRVCGSDCRELNGNVRRCGDGVVNARLPEDGSGSGWEECDDANDDWLDGCDAACHLPELRCAAPGEESILSVSKSAAAFVGISAGTAHVCAVAPDGLLSCWNRPSKAAAYEAIALSEERVAIAGNGEDEVRALVEQRLQSAGRYTCVVQDESRTRCFWMHPKLLREGKGPQIFDFPTASVVRLHLTDAGLCALTREGQKCWQFSLRDLETVTAEVLVPQGEWSDALLVPAARGSEGPGWLCLLGEKDGRTYCRERELPQSNEPSAAGPTAAYGSSLGNSAPEGSGAFVIPQTLALTRLPRSKSLWLSSAGVCAVGEDRVGCVGELDAASIEPPYTEARLDDLSTERPLAPSRVQTTAVVKTADGLCAIAGVSWEGDVPTFVWRCVGRQVRPDVIGLIDGTRTQMCWWSGVGKPNGILSGHYSLPPLDQVWGGDAPPSGWFDGSDAARLREWVRRKSQEGDDPNQGRQILDWARERSKGKN